MDEEEEWGTLCDQTSHSCFKDITKVAASFCPLSSLKQRHLNSRLFILKGMHILKQPIAAADHSRFPAFFFHQGEQMSGIRRRDLVTVSIGTDIALLHPRKMLIQLRIEILPVPIPAASHRCQRASPRTPTRHGSMTECRVCSPQYRL